MQFIHEIGWWVELSGLAQSFEGGFKGFKRLYSTNGE